MCYVINYALTRESFPLDLTYYNTNTATAKFSQQTEMKPYRNQIIHKAQGNC